MRLYPTNFLEKQENHPTPQSGLPMLVENLTLDLIE
jgi:hypothetical protein